MYQLRREKKLTLKAVKRINELVYKVNFRNVLRNKISVNGILENCKTIDEMSDIDIDLSHDKCINSVLEKKNALCNSTFSSSISKVPKKVSVIISIKTYVNVVFFLNSLISGVILFWSAQCSRNERSMFIMLHVSCIISIC